jgi:hypothetical protein
MKVKKNIVLTDREVAIAVCFYLIQKGVLKNPKDIVVYGLCKGEDGIFYQSFDVTEEDGE